jgi:hypothetical protein
MAKKIATAAKKTATAAKKATTTAKKSTPKVAAKATAKKKIS